MNQVTIYSTPTCGYCRVAKDFFTANNVQYEEKNVATDLAARQEMLDKTQQMGVPVIDVNGSVMVGYNAAKLRQLLGLS
jgi:glutaredoxin-like YruB-family protein